MIRLASPSILDSDMEKVINVLHSKNLVQGQYVATFEEEIQKYLNTKNAIVVSSGTAALHLALLALNIGVGDEVIVSNYTFPATANVVELVGATVKLVDTRKNSCMIDEEKIIDYITEKTKAIIPVQQFGGCVNMKRIMEIAKEHNLYVIEDAACALGTRYNNTHAGTIGDIGCYSLHPRKAITTGEGGIVVTSDDNIAKKVRLLRNHGMTVEDNMRFFEGIGLNYRMTEFQAVLGIEQLARFEEVITKRRILVQHYRELFLKENLPIQIIEEDETVLSTFQTLFIYLHKGVYGKNFSDYAKKRGVESNCGSYCVHELSYYAKKYKYDSNNYFNSKKLFDHGVAIPLHEGMTIDDVYEVVSVIKDFYTHI